MQFKITINDENTFRLLGQVIFGDAHTFDYVEDDEWVPSSSDPHALVPSTYSWLRSVAWPLGTDFTELLGDFKFSDITPDFVDRQLEEHVLDKIKFIDKHAQLGKPLLVPDVVAHTY